MTSGNFIIGDDLSLEGFNYYIKPNLEKYKVQITDFMVFNGRHFNCGNLNKHLLVSLMGDNGSLEEIIKKSMEEADNSIEKDQKGVAWNHQISSFGKVFFETLGLYNDDKTASKIYQNLAIKYSSIDAEDTLEEFENKISCFAKKFK